MNKSELKKLAASLIEKNCEEIFRSCETLLRMPELAYKEEKTSAFAAAHLEKLGLKVKKDLAITGLRADVDTGRPGPRLAILGELDGLIVPNHAFADPVLQKYPSLGAEKIFAGIIFKNKVI